MTDGPGRGHGRRARYRTEPMALLGELLEDQSRAQPALAADAGPTIQDALRILNGLGWKSGPRRNQAPPCAGTCCGWNWVGSRVRRSSTSGRI